MQVDDPGIVRLLEMVEADANGCWVWKSAFSPNSYGMLSFCGKSWLAHRLFYQIFRGPLVRGLMIRHRCHNRPCCNPAHLLQGTYSDNKLDDARQPEYPSFEGPTWITSRIIRSDMVS